MTQPTSEHTDTGANPRIHPGSILRHRESGSEHIVLSRKVGADAIPHPGWWLTDGGGLADFVIAAQWQVLN